MSLQRKKILFVNITKKKRSKKVLTVQCTPVCSPENMELVFQKANELLNGRYELQVMPIRNVDGKLCCMLCWVFFCSMPEIDKCVCVRGFLFCFSRRIRKSELKSSQKLLLQCFHFVGSAHVWAMKSISKGHHQLFL